MSVLSVRIRQRREELGMSQEELAARMGYRSKSSITKIEKGINDIPQNKLEDFAAALETTTPPPSGTGILSASGSSPRWNRARLRRCASGRKPPSNISTARGIPSCCWPTTPPSARP